MKFATKEPVHIQTICIRFKSNDKSRNSFQESQIRSLISFS